MTTDNYLGVTVDSAADPEVFDDRVGSNIGVAIDAITVRTWLVTSYFALAVLLLTGHN